MLGCSTQQPAHSGYNTWYSSKYLQVKQNFNLTNSRSKLYPTQITREPSSIPGLVTAFCKAKNTTNLSPGNCDTAIKLLGNQKNAQKRYVHPITGRRLREPSSPSPTLEKNTKTANDTLINQQQQSSLQDEANRATSRNMDTDFSGSNNKRPQYNH